VRVERLRFRLRDEHQGLRLDAVLGDWLPTVVGLSLSKSAVRRLVMAGAVLLDGVPTRRPGLTLDAGGTIEARVDVGRLQRCEVRFDAGGTRTSRPAGSQPISILFEDRWIVAVAKPAGLQMHPSADRSRPDLFTGVRARLSRARPSETGEPYLALHHRLDIDTSGVVLFAVDEEANAGLARAFAEHRVEKIYEAITVRPKRVPDGSWTARGALAMVGTGRHSRMTVVRDGQPAETAFVVARRLRSALLIEARPATGRKHQVRAHLADAGLPILGDVRYGGDAAVCGVRIPRVMLHAAALRLSHPVTGAPLDLWCPRPRDFDQVLGRLEPPGRPPGRSLDTPRASR
jgi:RluA family pseudouridine synthase